MRQEFAMGSEAMLIPQHAFLTVQRVSDLHLAHQTARSNLMDADEPPVLKITTNRAASSPYCESLCRSCRIRAIKHHGSWLSHDEGRA